MDHITYERNQNVIKMDGTYNIWMEPEHTQNGWNLFMFPNPTPDTLNWSVMGLTEPVQGELKNKSQSSNIIVVTITVE